MTKRPAAKPSFFDRLWQSIKSVFGRAVKKETKYRKLTKAEHEKLGLKPTSKRYVPDHIRRVTKKTKTLSQRKAIEANGFSMLNRETGQSTVVKGVSKEAMTRTRQKKVRGGVRYFDISPKDFARIERLAAGHGTQIIAFGSSNDVQYSEDGNDEKFHATGMIGPDELRDELERMHDQRGDRMGFSANNLPKRVDVYIQIKTREQLKAEDKANPPKTKKKKKSRHSKASGK